MQVSQSSFGVPSFFLIFNQKFLKKLIAVLIITPNGHPACVEPKSYEGVTVSLAMRSFYQDTSD